jgi:hypothetical protein
MKRILLFVFLLLGVQTFAQEYDKLIIGNDTTMCQLNISHRKGEIVVLFKKSYQASWNEIYAESANEAFVDGKSLYLSVQLPEIEKRVWARCFFDGIYKLLQYRDEFYIGEAGKLTRLTDRNNRNEEEKSSGARRFIGQMILLFKDKIEYNFNLLSYDSKSLVVPIIKYHQTNKLPYRDYNKYIEINRKWSIGAGLSSDHFKLSTQLQTPVDAKGYSPYVSANVSLCFPQLSNRLFLIGGIEISNQRIDALKICSNSNYTYYFDLSYNGVNVAVPAMVGFMLVDSPKIAISLATGLKIMKDFLMDQRLQFETEKDNVIKTELATITNNSKLLLQHSSELVIGLPILSKSISLGTAYTYSLANKSQLKNTVSFDRSLSVFARFTF